MHGTPSRISSKDHSTGNIEFHSQQIVGGNHLAVGTGIQPVGNETVEPPEVNQELQGCIRNQMMHAMVSRWHRMRC
jgi:hypothetical protein